MNLTINGKNIETRFGMAFIREINKQHTTKKGEKGGQWGVMFAYSYLHEEKPELVAEVLSHATAHIKSDRPTKDEIDQFLDTVADFSEFCDELKSELEEATLTKKAVVEAKKVIKQAQEPEINKKNTKTTLSTSK